jgi:hypothetical protein
VLQNIAQI